MNTRQEVTFAKQGLGGIKKEQKQCLLLERLIEIPGGKAGWGRGCVRVLWLLLQTPTSLRTNIHLFSRALGSRSLKPSSVGQSQGVCGAGSFWSGRVCFLAFPHVRVVHMYWLVAPSSIFKASWVAPSLLADPLPPFYKDLVIILGPPGLRVSQVAQW